MRQYAAERYAAEIDADEWKQDRRRLQRLWKSTVIGTRMLHDSGTLDGKQRSHRAVTSPQRWCA